jgi:hypothetical protein
MKMRGDNEMISRMALSTILQGFTVATAFLQWQVGHKFLPHARSLLSTKFDDSELNLKKERLRKLVQTYDAQPIWQISSQYNAAKYMSLSDVKGLVDPTPTLVAHKHFQEWLHGIQHLLFLEGLGGCGKTIAW